jgi:hypothetical protein
MINALGTDNDETERQQAEDRSVSPEGHSEDVQPDMAHERGASGDSGPKGGHASSEDDDDVPDLNKLQQSSIFTFSHKTSWKEAEVPSAGQSSRPVFNKMTSSIHAIYAGMDSQGQHEDEEEEASAYEHASPLTASPKQNSPTSSQYMQLPPIEATNLSKTPTPAREPVLEQTDTT